MLPSCEVVACCAIDKRDASVSGVATRTSSRTWAKDTPPPGERRPDVPLAPRPEPGLDLLHRLVAGRQGGDGLELALHATSRG
jgi:hypothetical protein